MEMKFDFWTILNLIFAVIILSVVVKKMLLAMRMNIAVLNLDGIISYNGKAGSDFGWLVNMMLSMAKNAKSKALILRINSPGGTVGASQEIYEAIKKVRAAGIKVVALMEDVAASGGLYVAMAADKVIANSGTLTGSIGVIIKWNEYSKILEFLKVKTNVIKSGDFKDVLSSAREMTEAEKQLLQDMVNSAYEQFAGTVAKDRGLSREQVAEFADGRVFTGAQALGLGLIDEIGGLDTAIDVAGDLAGIPKDKRCAEHLERKISFAEVMSKKNNLFGILPTTANPDLSGIPLWLMLK